MQAISGCSSLKGPLSAGQVERRECTRMSATPPVAGSTKHMSFRAHLAGTALHLCTPRRAFKLHIRQTMAGSMISSNDFRNGVTIEFDGAPWKVVEFLHVKPGKGAAFVRTKLKNCITGGQQEKTWRAGEMVAAAEVEKSAQQFSYMDGDDFVFMNMETFEETKLPSTEVPKDYIVEGSEVSVLEWNGRVIGCECPKNVTLEVVRADPGVKGNTATNATKPVTLVTGAELQVPLFINEGDMIMIDTEEGKYLKRVNDK
mmetsp:Transcript_4658/g.16690  ORF Transcript_4658/g.16690 Transcript_4658/m.16690 type:complete len:258 (-) Transcript_4658:1832-2605(-)